MQAQTDVQLDSAQVKFLQELLNTINEKRPAVSEAIHHYQDRASWVSADLLCWLRGTASQSWCNTSDEDFRNQAASTKYCLNLFQQLLEDFLTVPQFTAHRKSLRPSTRPAIVGFGTIRNQLNLISAMEIVFPSSASPEDAAQDPKYTEQDLEKAFENIARRSHDLEYETQLLLSRVYSLTSKAQAIENYSASTLDSLGKQVVECLHRLKAIETLVEATNQTVFTARTLQKQFPQACGTQNDKVLGANCPSEVAEAFSPDSKLGKGILSIKSSPTGLTVRTNRICKASQVKRVLKEMNFSGTVICWVHGKDVPEDC
jgi:predicted transcriptional regulator